MHWRRRVLGSGAALLIGAGSASARLDGPPSQPREIEVVASRFAFEPARIEVDEGERIRLLVRSADGVHGVEIKRFRVKRPVPRGGKPVSVEFTASAPGTYEILCSEYCGDGHETMTGTLVVLARPR